MIRLSAEASADLQDISERIKDDNGASVASRVTEVIFDGIRQLEQLSAEASADLQDISERIKEDNGQGGFAIPVS